MGALVYIVLIVYSCAHVGTVNRSRTMGAGARSVNSDDGGLTVLGV